MAKLKAKNVDLRFVNLELSDFKAVFKVADLLPTEPPAEPNKNTAKCLWHAVDVGGGKKQAILHGDLHLTADVELDATKLKAAFMELKCDATMPVTFKKGETVVDTGLARKGEETGISVKCPDDNTVTASAASGTIKVTRTSATEKLDTTVTFVGVKLAELFIVEPKLGLVIKPDEIVNHLDATVELVKPAGKKSNDESFAITMADGRDSALRLPKLDVE